MTSTRRTRRRALLLPAALLASVAIAACGGSGNSGGSSKAASSKNAASTTATKSGASARRTAFTTCLKQHGVTLPNRAGGGFFRRGTSTTGGTSTTAGGTSTNGIHLTQPSGSGSEGGVPDGGPPSGQGGAAGPIGAGGGRGFPGGGFARGNSKFAKAFQACRSKLPAGSFGPGRFGQGGTGTRHFAPRFSTAALKSYVACVRKNGYPSMPEPDTSSGATSVFPGSVEKSAKFRAASAKCTSILRQAFRPGAAGPPSTSSGAATSATSAA